MAAAVAVCVCVCVVVVVVVVGVGNRARSRRPRGRAGATELTRTMCCRSGPSGPARRRCQWLSAGRRPSGAAEAAGVQNRPSSLPPPPPAAASIRPASLAVRQSACRAPR